MEGPSSRTLDKSVSKEPEFPYPSNLSAASFISVKLTGRDKYGAWKMQMLCLFESHDMSDFIDGTIFSYDYGRKLQRRSKASYKLWRRSDSVVKGWILGSLSEEILMSVFKRLTSGLPSQKSEYLSAADFWNELHSLYDPVPMFFTEVSPVEAENRLIIGNDQKSLHQYILAGNWDGVDRILKTRKVTVIERITENGNTALHVAASSTKKLKLLKELLKQTPENKELDGVRNSDGSTVLHVAAIVGNIEAARILVVGNPGLLLAKDNGNQTPLAIALFNMDTKMSEFLLHRMNTDIERGTQFSDASGDELLVILISSKDFRLAHDLLEHYRRLQNDAVLMAIAQNFPSELNTWEKYLGTGIIGSRVKKVLDSVQDDMLNTCVPLCGSWVETILWLFFLGIYGFIMLFPFTLKMLAWLFIKKRGQTHDDAKDLLTKVCKLIKDTESFPEDFYGYPIVEASRQNANEVVEGIVKHFRAAIRSGNKDGHNMIQIAVIYRSEKVYNLLYQMSEHKNVYRTMKDPYDNNLLHLAGKLAPTDKLDLITGAFLQIQRELQWFKEVERFVSPLSINQKNFFGETPQMVFTREHKELVKEGERWMKDTAGSYTITAALITTIVFAAAITVPGGNNQDTGIPLFTNNTVFAVFAISDAIALLASVTSLLIFLSILTARYAEQDFLLKLPTKLIIGLVTLFISTTAMLVASGATLYLVFGQNNSKILITIIVFTCLPIAVFVTLQSRLIIDLMSATYGRSIFGKKNDRPFY